MASSIAPAMSYGTLSRRATAPLPPSRTRPSSGDIGSCIWGSRLSSSSSLTFESQRRVAIACGKVYATTFVETGVKIYSLPSWAEFEIGRYPVFWETTSGRPPTSGESFTIYFNPGAGKLVPNAEYGIAFNGGFNQPIMCGGEPRVMTRRDRGTTCTPFYTIKINVPAHALTLEFSFTDGKEWDGPYKMKFEVPQKWRNKPADFFNEGLAKELSREGACEDAIYPDAASVQDRCVFPAGIIHEGGNRCELDIVPGCTDPESPFFNPLANVDDGSCPYISDDE